MTAARQPVRLGFVGFGEVGFAVARGLRAEGLATLAAIDSAGGAAATLVRERAAQAGVDLLAGPAELAARCDIVLGLTPGIATLDSAAALAPHLDAGHCYADLASATPRIKLAVAERLHGSGVRFADGSIMGAPLIDGHRVEILASGPAAVAVASALAPWGCNIQVVGGQTGAASAIKIFRSVIAKGLEALLVECLLATEQYGISADVLGSYARFLGAQPFDEIAAFLVRTDVLHAGRRAEEAAMAAEALDQAGVDPVMTRATVARLRGVAALGLRDAFGATVPADYATAIAAIAAGLRARP